MSTTAAGLEDTVRRVPVWGWAALAGGAALIMISRHNKTAAAVIDPNAATPDLSGMGVPQGGSGAIYDPGLGVSPGTTPDPGNTGPTPPPTAQRFTDILGGSIAQFIAGLPVAPNELSFTDAYGQTFHESNNENALYYAAAAQHDTNFFQALMALINSGNLAPGTDWSWLFGHAPTPWTTPTPIAIGTNPTPIGTGRGTESCANGDTACITARCHPGDVACAHSYAPWWNGAPIPGWS